MRNPYEVLGLDTNADESLIRSRYLEQVRQFSPERDPERFAEIRAAYEQLRDPRVSLEHRLFDIRSYQTFDELVASSQPDPQAQRIPTATLLALGDS